VTDDADRSAPIDDKEESGPPPAVIEKRGRRSLSKQQRLATEASRTESPTSTKRSNSRKLKSDETSKESDVKQVTRPGHRVEVAHEVDEKDSWLMRFPNPVTTLRNQLGIKLKMISPKLQA